jgi:hypothetical protein
MPENRNSKNVGQSNIDTRIVNQNASQAAKSAQDRDNQNPANDDRDCGQRRKVSDIQPQMEVISSCGCTMGKVDRMDGNAIKLTRNDSPDGQHHFIPANWVESVDNHVHLKKNAEETMQGWKSDAASCSN